MKIYLTSLIFLASATHSASWIEVSGDYECPNLLILFESRYEVFNDCYGFDPRSPVIDSGRFEEIDGHFIFSERKIEQPSFLGGRGVMSFEVISKTNTALRIRTGSITHTFKTYSSAK